MVREFFQCNLRGICGLKNKLESLELPNSAGVNPAGLTLSFLQATKESFAGRI